MRPIQQQFAPYRTTVVSLKGGINENVNSLELTGGELIDCRNYMIAEGGYGGYTSIKGYERYDGLGKPSEEPAYILTIADNSVAILEGDTIVFPSGSVVASADAVVTAGNAVVEVGNLVGALVLNETATVSGVYAGVLLSDPPLPLATDQYHATLEKRRAAVLPVPGEGDILGVHVYRGSIYAYRKKVGLNVVGMYKEDPVTGWAEVDTSGSPITYSSGGHTFRFSNWNFLAGTDAYSMFWVDGVNTAFAYDGTTVTPVVNTGMTAIGDAPINLIAFNNYLHLVYPHGSLQLSTQGDPFDWVTAPISFDLGGEITNVIAGVKGSLMIYLVEGIQILTGSDETDFLMQTFSMKSGAREGTASRILGTQFFLDDTGLTTLESVDAYGDYGANSISKNFKSTLLNPNHTVTAMVVSRDLNQYRLFFDDRQGIFVSFEGKELNGATVVEYDRTVDVASSSEKSDGVELLVFASSGSPYVYIMDSGTSFDGNTLITRLSTAFYHYQSPRTLKGFKRLTVEAVGTQNQLFYIKDLYEYNEPTQPNNPWHTSSIYTTDGSAVYGFSKWGLMQYGAAQVATNRLPVYLSGVATNVSFKIISQETYRPQHIIQNFIVDYTGLNRRV